MIKNNATSVFNYEKRISEITSILLFSSLLLVGIFFQYADYYDHVATETIIGSVLFLIPYLLIRAERVKLGAILLGFLLPLSIITLSVLVKNHFIDQGAISPNNYIYARLLLIFAALIPVLITPITDKKSLFLNLSPTFIIIALYDPIHNFFGVGFEKTGIESSNYYWITNAFCISAAILLNIGILSLKSSLEQYIRRYKTIASDYIKFFDSAHDPILILTLEEEIILNVNERATQLYGYSKEELIGKSLKDLTVDIKRGEKLIKQVLGKSSISGVKTEQYNKKGGKILIDSNASIIDYRGQKVLLCINRDVTEEKQKEYNLNKAKELAQFGFWEFNLQTGEITWSEQCLMNFGLNQDDNLDYEKLLKIVSKEDHPIIEKIFVTHSLENGAVSHEIRIITDDQKVKYIQMMAELDINFTGEPTRIIGNTMDITALRETQNALAYLEDSLHVGTYKYDGNTGLFYVSDTVYNIFNRPTEYQTTNFDGFIKYVHPEDKQYVIETFKDHELNQKEFGVNFRVITEDQITKYLLVYGKGVYDHTGKLVETLGTVMDITENRKLELAKLKNEQFLKTVFDNIPNLVFIKNAEDLKFAEVNKAAAQVIGKTREEIIGRTDYEFFEKHIADQFTQSDEAVLNNGNDGVTFEEIVKNEKFPTPRLFKTKKIPIKDKSGKNQYILGITEDITEQKKALEDIKQSEERLKIITETATNGTWEWDITKKVFSWSNTAKDYLGIETNEIEDVDVKLFIHPDDYHKHIEALRKSITDKKNYSVELRLKSKLTGNYTWTQSNGKLVMGQHGNPIKMLGIFIDIEKRKQADKLLLEGERLLNQINQTVPNLIYVYDNKLRKFVFINNKANEILGYSTDEFKALDIHGLADLRHKDDRGKVEKHYRSLKDQFQEVTYRFRHKSGKWVWLESRDVIFSRDDEGNVHQIIGAVTDVTEKQNYQLEMESVNNELRLFRHALDVSSLVSFTDKDGKITYVNDKMASMFGFERQELVGKDHREIKSGEHSKEFISELWKTIQKGEIWNDIMLNKSKSGKKYWLDTFIIPQLNSKNEVIRYLSVRHDVTPLKDVEASLESKNRELDEFVYIVSHDLKAPLRGINNLVHWISEDSKEENPQVLRNIELLKNRISRLDRFINGLLDYSRIGREVLRTEKVNTYALVSDLASLLVQMDENVLLEINPKLPEIDGYRIFITQVFNNLISNAIKHNESDEKRVKIDFRIEEPNIIFSVEDNGSGIPDSAGEKIFQIFQTAVSKDKKENTGIGLSIVNKTVNEMNGKIWYENNTPNNGCTFYLELPLVVD